MNIQNQLGENPAIVLWEVTRACAFACSHCRAEANTKPDSRELSPTEARRLINQVARAKPGMFILTGGDPTYRPDLVSLIEYATAQGLRVALNPSATTRFLKVDLLALRGAGLRAISLGLDGSTPATHDDFRGVPGAWQWTIQASKAARQAGISVEMNTTFTRRNMGEFHAVAALLEQLQPAVWNLFQLVPSARVKSQDMLTGAQMEDLFNNLADLAPVAGYEVRTTEGQHYRRVALQKWQAQGGRRPEVTPINDGRGSVFVSHSGEICPGAFLPLVAGNVRVDDLLDIYRDSTLFLELRNPELLKGKCGGCEYRTLCGGSRARAYATTRDYLAQDPLCIYQPRYAAVQHRPALSTRQIWRMYRDD
jgi:radical SAM protein with 4Fe4S-binding SPASM domain